MFLKSLRIILRPRDGIREYHDELEYLHIKFFLGNSFLRSTKIADRAGSENDDSDGVGAVESKLPELEEEPVSEVAGRNEKSLFQNRK